MACIVFSEVINLKEMSEEEKVGEHTSKREERRLKWEGKREERTKHDIEAFVFAPTRVSASAYTILTFWMLNIKI